jgi:hypothetical protein
MLALSMIVHLVMITLFGALSIATVATRGASAQTSMKI